MMRYTQPVPSDAQIPDNRDFTVLFKEQASMETSTVGYARCVCFSTVGILLRESSRRLCMR